MIIGAALAEWLADRDAQRRTGDAVDACIRKWAHHPSLAELDADVRAADPRTPEALLAMGRRYLDRSDDIEALMRDLIAESRADPFFQPPFGPLSNEIMQGLLLYQHPDLLITLCMTRLDELAGKKAFKRKSGSVNFIGYMTLLRFVQASGALLTIWEAPRIGKDFDASAAGRCHVAEQRRISDGEEVVIDGRYQSFTIDHAVGDIVYFHIMSPQGASSVSAEFDAETGELVGASSADEVASRIQMMATLLRAMECREAMPLLESALASPQFYTRWHVMREMLALDAEEALPALRRMAESDPHPDIRLAARESLDMFFPESAGDLACPA